MQLLVWIVQSGLERRWRWRRRCICDEVTYKRCFLSWSSLWSRRWIHCRHLPARRVHVCTFTVSWNTFKPLQRAVYRWTRRGKSSSLLQFMTHFQPANMTDATWSLLFWSCTESFIKLLVCRKTGVVYTWTRRQWLETNKKPFIFYTTSQRGGDKPPDCSLSIHLWAHAITLLR